MGLTVIDAGILIGFFDASDVHHLGAKRELANAQQRGDQIAIPASALAEALVSPSRHGESSVTAILEFIERLPVVVAELDIDTAVWQRDFELVMAKRSSCLTPWLLLPPSTLKPVYLSQLIEGGPPRAN